MSVSTLLRQLLPATARRLHADLAVVTVVTVLTIVVVLVPPVNDTILRFAFGMLFLLFLPGYAFISALFPEAHVPEGPPTGDGSEAETTGILPGRLYTKTGIDGVERVALAFGTSVAIVPLIGIALSFTPWGIGLLSIVFAVAAFTLCAVVVATYRRVALPEDRRFTVPYQTWVGSGWPWSGDTESRLDVLLTIVLAVSVLLAFGSVTYAVGSPPDGEQFSEFYILTEGPSGDLVAERYPTDLVAGEPEPIVIGIENNEGRSTAYTVVIEVQEVQRLEDNQVQVVDRDRVNTFEPTVGGGETWQVEHDLVSTMTGTDLRVAYMLYVGEPPAEPSTETADQSLHLWVDVTGSGTTVER